MRRYNLFVSSVQKEFSAERRAISDFIHGDSLLHRFFEVFLFEDLPASDRRQDAAYLAEADSCDIYIGCSEMSMVTKRERVFRLLNVNLTVRLLRGRNV